MKRGEFALAGLIVAGTIVGGLTAPACRTGAVLDPRAVVAGCDRGARLVQAQVVLAPNAAGQCAASVEPERLCVQQGGRMVWQIDNRCGALTGQARPAFALVLSERKAPAAERWFAGCAVARARVPAGARTKDHRVDCRLPADAPLGVHKYNLEGAFATLDPRIEVTPPILP